MDCDIQLIERVDDLMPLLFQHLDSSDTDYHAVIIIIIDFYFRKSFVFTCGKLVG